MAKKNNIRSIRFSDEMIEMIESQDGDTFTAKFEALVRKCIWQLPRKEEELKGIQEQIDRERKNLRYIQERKQNLYTQLNRMETLSNMATAQLKRCIEGLENIEL